MMAIRRLLQRIWPRKTASTGFELARPADLEARPARPPLTELERKYGQALCDLLALWVIEEYHSERKYLGYFGGGAHEIKMRVRQAALNQAGAKLSIHANPHEISQELRRLGYRHDMQISGFIHDEE